MTKTDQFALFVPSGRKLSSVELEGSFIPSSTLITLRPEANSRAIIFRIVLLIIVLILSSFNL
jgi:hypothetical protein